LHAVGHVVGVDGKTAAGHAAGGGEVLVDKTAGVEQVDAEFFDFVGDGAEDGFGVAAFEGHEDAGGLEVGVKALEEAARGDLAGHECVAGVEVLERGEHFTQLADFDDAALGGGDGVDEVGAGFLLHGDEAEGDAGAADGLGDEHRINALAGDERDGALWIKVGRKECGQHRRRLQGWRACESPKGRRRGFTLRKAWG
jgi:hypothetical protein